MCEKCNNTGERRVPRGSGVALIRCSCSPKVSTPVEERTSICPICKGKRWSEVPSQGLGKESQICSFCGGVGKV